ncbi:MAG: ATP phosphoribosyltransferase regulatory subunit [Nitrospinae bacterium]|nr:ATP phosphoribosyltransferase regulatory subunit [Nitrospinota bacterium]
MKPHITAIPQGTRTFLFEEAELKRRIEQEIHARLKERGFQEIVTPLLEYYDSAAVALGDEAGRIIRFAEEESGMAMALRADITSQVARSAATHLGKLPLPLKLCYNGPVFRRAQKGKGEQYVLNQSGMEIIGEPAPEGDGRIVEAIMACMKAVGLESYTFSVGHAGILGFLLNEIPPASAGKIKTAISKKDKAALARELDKSGVDARTSGAVAGLAGLCGGVSVLDEAERLCGWHDGAASAVGNLKSFLRLAEPAGFEKRLVLDFGETRGRGYYTGIIMEIFSDSMPALGAGGRYDNLVGRYGKDLPAVGFAFDVERLMEAVTRQNARSKRER